jgi:TPR repeat protein
LKKCPQCGTQNQAAAKFCGKCGNVFKAQPKTAAPRFSKAQIVIAVVVLGGIAACGFLIQGSGDNPDKASASLSVDQLDQKGIVDFNAKKYEPALKWFEKAADKGDFAAINWVGWIYENGLGLPTDNAQAVSWFHKAADKGFAPSETNLAWCYQNGLGVSVDVAQAVDLYQKAAAQGNDSAEINLGYLYEKGTGVAQSDSEAKKWYKLAADHGSQEGKQNLDRLEASQVHLSDVTHALAAGQ